MAAAEKGLPPVIMFAFDDYFPAVAATDLLVSQSSREEEEKEEKNNNQIQSQNWQLVLVRYGAVDLDLDLPEITDDK